MGVPAVKKVLMVAFHFPPFGGGTGMQRTLKFANYLSEYGWQPIVLTVSPHAYPERQPAEIPSNILVSRAFALDTVRHLAIAGKHIGVTALPDRWISWWPAAVGLGAALIRRHRPDAIWSTYPIATAHLIGMTLHRWSGIPWVADIRDPLVSTNPVSGIIYPSDPMLRKVRSWVETGTVKYASRTVFTTPGTLSMYKDRFPEVPEDRWAVIPNGYDEEDFAAAEKTASPGALPRNPVVLVHSGELYRNGRNPVTFFKALADLKRAGRISASTLKVILRATSDDEYYRTQTRDLAIEDIVFIEPPVSHNRAVVEMLEAHGLLLLQGSTFNPQIPAKAYEYLRSGRPIFAIVDEAGDTAGLLRSEGIKSVVPMDSKEEIAAGLMSFLTELSHGEPQIGLQVKRHSRKARTLELASLLESVVVAGGSSTFPLSAYRKNKGIEDLSTSNSTSDL